MSKNKLETKTFLELQITYREIFDKEPIYEANKIARTAMLDLFNKSRWVSVDALKSSEVLERLAELEHEQWIDLMKSLFDSDLIRLTRFDSQRLKRLMATPYAKLAEFEKESDRKFARKVLKVLLDGCEERRE